MLQSEAIAALGGEKFENDLIIRRFDEFKRRTSRLFLAYWQFGVSTH
eukprot:SAG31_NODE_770_length_12217_cov_2.855174_2_plen_47_part_00